MPAAGIETHRLTGIDIDGKAIDWSWEHMPGIRFVRCRPMDRKQVQEGRKFCLSFLPPEHLRTLLSELFCHVEAIQTGRDVPQDVWVAINAHE